MTAVGFLWGLVTEVTNADDVFFGGKVESVASKWLLDSGERNGAKLLKVALVKWRQNINKQNR